MKLRRLRLENFRQFKGVQELEFAQDSDKNVTLIWGANGAGKTTLLNAFTWVLYNHFTKDFEKTDTLANSGAWLELDTGQKLTVEVELEFENDGNIFTATRTSVYRKTNDGSAVAEENARASLTYIDHTGRSQKSGNPDDHLRQILPDRLHSFFFFNGERIEHLVQASAYEEIEDAIKTILGLRVVERAIKHLPNAAKKFEQELRAHGTDEQREITTELEDLDRRLELAIVERGECEKRASGWQDEIDAIDMKLRGTEQAREQQRQRDSLNDKEMQSNADIAKTNERIDRLIRERGFLAFGKKLFDDTRVRFVDKREKKELPAPVKRDFIDDLLADQTCICGASLAPGTHGHDHIMSWKARAGLAEVEQRWIELHAQADQFLSQRADLSADLQSLLDDRQEAIERRQHVREQLSELSQALQHITIDNIDGLESSRVSAERKKEEEIRQQGRLEQSINDIRTKKTVLEANLKKAEGIEARAELARRRSTVTREALNTLEKVYKIRTDQTRSDLDAKIKEVYQRISFKDYVPEVNEMFQLNLVHAATREPVAKSTGENQILSLSFVGALASIARSRYESTKGAISARGEARGGIYPIVMDAAFGSLDDRYRREVAMGLPGLAEQVVVIVSKSGGFGAFEHFSDRVGRSYIIQYVTPKADAEPEGITLDGFEYDYVIPSGDGSEYATIGEV